MKALNEKFKFIQIDTKLRKAKTQKQYQPFKQTLVDCFMEWPPHVARAIVFFSLRSTLSALSLPSHSEDFYFKFIIMIIITSLASVQFSCDDTMVAGRFKMRVIRNFYGFSGKKSSGFIGRFRFV